MPRITVDKLEPGMKLARPVMRGSMVLLGEGTELNDNWIQKIKSMEIESVYIDGPSQMSVPKDEMMAQLEDRFKNVADEPYMDVIKKLVRKHIEDLYE
ncbi:MAG: hypothetical protein JXC33_01940 [Deltaproteobacteria bacterium]|nr:hypothetical protein [Deltaproteobacteria bacterium]